MSEYHEQWFILFLILLFCFLPIYLHFVHYHSWDDNLQYAMSHFYNFTQRNLIPKIRSKKSKEMIECHNMKHQQWMIVGVRADLLLIFYVCQYSVFVVWLCDIPLGPILRCSMFPGQNKTITSFCCNRFGLEFQEPVSDPAFQFYWIGKFFNYEVASTCECELILWIWAIVSLHKFLLMFLSGQFTCWILWLCISWL